MKSIKVLTKLDQFSTSSAALALSNEKKQALSGRRIFLEEISLVHQEGIYAEKFFGGSKPEIGGPSAVILPWRGSAG